MDSRLRSSLAGFVCKLDIEKSYDHVNWDFYNSYAREDGLREEMLSMDQIFPIDCWFSVW